MGRFLSRNFCCRLDAMQFLSNLISKFFCCKLLWKGNWFTQEKSCKILSLIVSGRPKSQDPATANGESNSKKEITTINVVLKGLVDWLCAQLKSPSHPSRGIPTAINCLATLLKEPVVRSSFVQADGVKLLVPLISPASTQQSILVFIKLGLWVSCLNHPFHPPLLNSHPDRFTSSDPKLSELTGNLVGSTNRVAQFVVQLR